MLHKSRSDRPPTRKVSPPGPVYMTDAQKSEYLSDLRKNRPIRPAGSRPLPWLQQTRGPPTPESTVEPPSWEPTASDSDVSLTALPKIKDDLEGIVPAPLFHRRTQSDMPIASSIASRTSAGRPLVRDTSQSGYSIRGRKVSPTAVIQPASIPNSSEYRESGARWMEKQEARSLRDALMEMDQHGEEKRIHDAAKNEAADLVWRHQNPRAAEDELVAAYKNPDLSSFKFTQHLERGAHARSQSQSYGELAKRTQRSAVSTRSASDSSASSNEGRGNTDTALPNASSMASRHKSGARVISSGSTKGLFRNPEDEIYEDPVQVQTHTNSPHVRFQLEKTYVSPRDSSPKGSRPPPPAPHSQKKRFSPFEIHKNPPSQSRNAGYTQNEHKPLPVVEVEGQGNGMKDGKEIRTDDILAATSMKRKDRNPNLPTPTAVCDQPGRPIVSFDPSWQPAQRAVKDIHMTREDSSRSHNRANSIPSSTRSDSTIPSISLPEDKADMGVPSIVLPEATHDASHKGGIPRIHLPTDDPCPDVPSINVSGDDMQASNPQSHPSTRPLPDPAAVSKASRRPRVPWLDRDAPPISRAGVPTATCATCLLPIAGRIITASGSNSQTTDKARFHPECFNCFHCSTSLEAAEFYPEPDGKRTERMKSEGLQEGDEGTELRFYCHLDFHEFFSPRCKNCKTPIEGEVIIAAGAEWHVGHFFCAECGDPFDSATPFVEKDGYAWCVACHTRRTSSRCRSCKKPVLDVTITALGGTWHSNCFVCLECGNDFEDNDGRFYVREIEAELTEKEKRKGMKPRMEERAVCTSCEERRLKA